MKSFVLLMSCPDQPGIVARITALLHEAGCNILALEQHVEDGKLFFMRIEADSAPTNATVDSLRGQLEELAVTLDAKLTLHDQSDRPRVAVLVSRDGACLAELLAKHKTGELGCEIALVIGNLDDLRPLAEAAGIPFEHVPADGMGGPHEARLLGLLKDARVDLVVLARYMRVLSGEFVNAYPQKIVNIHHGFLPAFKGARPYHQAWNKGVKIIGATAHYVTADLDEGPIIAQDVTRVNHQHSVTAMTQTGRDIEKRVLAEAVKAAVEHRIIVHGVRTVVFHP